MDGRFQKAHLFELVQSPSRIQHPFGTTERRKKFSYSYLSQDLKITNNLGEVIVTYPTVFVMKKEVKMEVLLNVFLTVSDKKWESGNK